MLKLVARAGAATKERDIAIATMMDFMARASYGCEIVDIVRLFTPRSAEKTSALAT